MKNSGLADSPFFKSSEERNALPPSEPTNAPTKDQKPLQVESSNEQKPKQPSNRDTMPPRHHATMPPRYHDTKQPSNRDTMSPRHNDTVTPRHHDAIIELVRKAVREFGKEAATHRFTEAEKKEIADLIYTYKNSGIKTNENEITRIAVNFILEDYKENGENSVLHNILAALNE